MKYLFLSMLVLCGCGLYGQTDEVECLPKVDGWEIKTNDIKCVWIVYDSTMNDSAKSLNNLYSFFVKKIPNLKIVNNRLVGSVEHTRIIPSDSCNLMNWNINYWFGFEIQWKKGKYKVIISDISEVNYDLSLNKSYMNQYYFNSEGCFVRWLRKPLLLALKKTYCVFRSEYKYKPTESSDW